MAFSPNRYVNRYVRYANRYPYPIFVGSPGRYGRRNWCGFPIAPPPPIPPPPLVGVAFGAGLATEESDRSIAFASIVDEALDAPTESMAAYARERNEARSETRGRSSSRKSPS